MLGLFKSKRNRWRDEAAQLFDVYIPSIKGLDPSEIGAFLDSAKEFKNTLIKRATENNDVFSIQALIEPISLPEDKGLTLLQVWHRKMTPGEPEKVAFVGALSIWWLSLAAGTFTELRVRGKEMWAELARGFTYSEAFDSGQDVPKGLDENYLHFAKCARCGHITYDHLDTRTGKVAKCYRCACLMFAER